MLHDDFGTGERVKELQEELLQIQKKTFTKWINALLQDVNLEVVDLFEDLSDGVALLKLLQIISGEKIGNAAVGKTGFHKIATVTKCLNFLNSKIHLESIGAKDIVQGNPRLIMGLLWTIIVRFQIEMIGAPTDRNKGNMSSGPRTAKEALLLWCQQRTAGYRGVHVHDFSRSWQDGLAFNALIHSKRPDLIAYDSLDRRNYIQNLENAFTIAEKHFGIPHLLDAEDFKVARPDEKSILTYLSQFYHTFNKTEESSRVVGMVSAPGSNSSDVIRKNWTNERTPTRDIGEESKLWKPSHNDKAKPATITHERSGSILEDKLRKAIVDQSSDKQNHTSAGNHQSLLSNGTNPSPAPDAWACAYCPSINLSTSQVCGACFKRRKEWMSNGALSSEKVTKSNETPNFRRSTGNVMMSVNRQAIDSTAETTRRRSFVRDRYYESQTATVSKSDEHLDRSTSLVGQSSPGIPPIALHKKELDSSEESLDYKQRMAEKLDKKLKGALELKVDKLELEIKNMKIQYYKRLDVSEARFQELEQQMIKTKEEKLRLQKLVEELVIGSEITKKKMLRLEQMLKNIFAPDRI